MIFNLRLALLGLITLTASATMPGCQTNKACCDSKACAADCAEKCEATAVELSSVPAAVRTTLDREAPGGAIEKVGTCTKAGATCYCIVASTGGKSYDLCIASDGTLQSKTIRN